MTSCINIYLDVSTKYTCYVLYFILLYQIIAKHKVWSCEIDWGCAGPNAPVSENHVGPLQVDPGNSDMFLCQKPHPTIHFLCQNHLQNNIFLTFVTS